MNGQMMLGIRWDTVVGTKSVQAHLWRRKSKVQKGGESDDVGGKRCHRVRAGQAKIDGIGIREGRNASGCFAAATTASMRSRGLVRLCLGLCGGRAAV